MIFAGRLQYLERYPMTPNESVQAGITRLFARHQAQLKAYAYAICRDAHLADDIVQEVAVVLITRTSAYDPERPFLPWAIGIARNKTLEMLRGRGRSLLVLDETMLDRVETALVNTAGPDYAEARLDAMMTCVEQVPPDARAVLGMKYVKGMSAQEIAAATHRNASAINSLLQRLRARVVECVDRRMAEVRP
jgi:RNA polymerase sigma-70 factor, ECF subfamily